VNEPLDVNNCLPDVLPPKFNFPDIYYSPYTEM
jgi:hypothetical protein